MCDVNLIGKEFREGNKVLNVRESFFKGNEFTHEETLKLIMEQKIEDATFNIIGDEAIKVAKEAGIIDKEGIARIENIPFALVLL